MSILILSRDLELMEDMFGILMEHDNQGGLGTFSFGYEEEVEDEEKKKDPKYGNAYCFLLIIELYKHFVKPGYKRVNKRLTVFDVENGIFSF